MMTVCRISESAFTVLPGIGQLRERKRATDNELLARNLDVFSQPVFLQQAFKHQLDLYLSLSRRPALFCWREHLLEHLLLPH